MSFSSDGSVYLACREIIERLLTNRWVEIDSLRKAVSRRHQLKSLLSNAEILAAASEREKRILLSIFQRKPIRSLSGVNVIAVMSPPHKCPHGRCAYCPNFLGVPNSYTGNEPSAMRGLQHAYDPNSQVTSRLKQLQIIGHSTSKLELIVQGGTFPAVSLDEQRTFVKGCFDAVIGRRSRSFKEAVTQAERCQLRIVGVTLETRPDCCSENAIDNMLDLGVTRVELGVQTLSDEVYRLVDRGHSVEEVREATRRLKDAGLKLCYHMMPGLPSSNFNEDIDTFDCLFSDQSFVPDMLKIYPCLVLENTKIYDWWRKGIYRPYTTGEAVELLAKIKPHIPHWVRIMRIQRDIPAQLIVAGVKKSNLRQLVQNRMLERGLRCRCIRCREVGHALLDYGIAPETLSPELTTTEYSASDGKEFLISFEDRDKDVLIGYLRLRLPSSKAHRPEILQEQTGLVRELHVYGSLVPVGDRLEGAWQHRGIGKTLLSKAEDVCLEQGIKLMLVISAVGVRKYFWTLGFRRFGPYMGKQLS